jgi:hypothetical protein
MGFLGNGAMMGIGQGLNQGTDNALRLFMFKQQQDQEKEKLQQQQALQAAQIAEYQSQADLRRKEMENQDLMRGEVTNLYAPPVAKDPQSFPDGGGMMAATPTSEQLMGVYNRYASPKEGLAAQVSLANTDEKVKSNEKIQDERNKAAAQRMIDKLDAQESMFRERMDAQSQALADKLAAQIEAIKTTYGLKQELQDARKEKPPTPTDHDKNYDSYLSQYQKDAKAGKYKNGERAMTRYEFDIWMAKQKPDRFQDLMDALNPGSAKTTTPQTRKPLSAFGG